MAGKDIDVEFFKKFDDGKKIFSTVFRQAKKNIILQDEDDFIESMSAGIQKDHSLSEDDSVRYASLIHQIWEERCGCSMTSFDQEISSLKKKIFA